MSEPAIEVEGLVKRYGGRTVVDRVSMRVEKGEIAGFLGPNGSGKTTTIRVMCGLLTPDEGGGKVLGHDLRQRARIKREIGYMTQRFSLYEDLTIAENLAFVAGLYGLRPIDRHVRDTLADLGLTARRDQLAGALSGGWKQRLALAACVMHSPRLLMLDEPTAGVDPKARREFWDEIHERAQAGLTVLVSTHYMDEAERCHRLGYIAYGELLASGSGEEVVRSQHLVTFEISGDIAPGMAEALRKLPGSELVASFGSALHVSGRDGPLLERGLAAQVADGALKMRRVDTSLEDAFINLMQGSRDQFEAAP